MEDSFKFRASLKSEDDLHNCINNRDKYLPETVEAAVNELQSRGEKFSEEELKVIEEDMQARRNLAESGADGSSLFNRNDKNLQVEDPEAPSFYSKRAVFVFSILFSVLFGAILLAINVGKTENRNKALLVVLFGLGYVGASVAIAENFNLNSSFSLILIFLGAYLLEALFWNRFIGRSTLYRATSIWVPLIIGVAILIPLIILIIYSGYYQ